MNDFQVEKAELNRKIDDARTTLAWIEECGVQVWPNRDKGKIKSWTVQLFVDVSGKKTCIQPTKPGLMEALGAAVAEWTQTQAVNRICDQVSFARRGVLMRQFGVTQATKTHELQGPGLQDLVRARPEPSGLLSAPDEILDGQDRPLPNRHGTRKLEDKTEEFITDNSGRSSRPGPIGSPGQQAPGQSQSAPAEGKDLC